VDVTDDDPVAAFWDDLLADAAATADEYREDGWETLELHPGDVTPLTGEYGDRVGLDVLVPDDEFRAVEAWFDAGFSVDGYRAFRSVVSGAVFVLAVVRDEGSQRALFVPAFYALDDPDARDLFGEARGAGHLRLFLRRLSGDYVDLALDDPELLAPPEDAAFDPGAQSPDVDGLLDGEEGL
jgi:hypothetical protein